MRMLPEILERRLNAGMLIVGGSDVSYGSRPHPGLTWKNILALEVPHKISDADWARLHFLGNIPYEYFIALLQLSSVYVS